MVTVCAPAELNIASLIRAGDTIVSSQLSAEPNTLLRRLCDAICPPGVKLFVGAHMSGALKGLAGIPIASYGAMFQNASLLHRGMLDVFPLRYSQLSWAVSEGQFKADVVLMQLAQDPASGKFYWSATHDYIARACARARVVIAECNSRAPIIQGARVPDDLRIDYLVHTDTPLPVLDMPGLHAEERRIAGHIAALVEDGSTLQLGIGALPHAVLHAFENHKNLGIHSGLISDGIMSLMECGVIDNSRKRSCAGITVTSALVGTEALYRWAHRNRTLKLANTYYTHGAATLAALHKPIAINSGLQVDLFGQVNAEIAGSRYLGGLGGLSDFAQGIRMAPDGQSIICLRSTVKSSGSGDHTPAQSRIVAKLDGLATLGCSDADIVVTEWGVARLRGLSLRQRIRAMIAIAHPDHRDGLSQQAKNLAC